MSSLIEAFQNLPLAQGLSFQNALSPKWWLSYAVKAYEDDPVHVLIEFSLFFIVLWLIFRKSYDPKSTDELSKQEEDALIADWKPEPLVKESGPKLAAEDRLLVDSAPTPQVTMNGKNVTNFCSTGFLGLAYRPEVKDAAKKTIEKYGVGSCGPRGFYGSIDVHLNLEKDIAEFVHMPESILYSDAIACVPSVIAAFAKRGDLIVCDDGAHFGIQQGLTLARCNVLYFKHNDMQDLERVLQDVRERDQASASKKLHRRFIMVEGLSANHGDIVPLNKIMELKDRYKYRVILDDSLAVGVLGKTGRGTPEMFNIPTETIDIVTGVLDGAFGSVGGYCVGLNRVVDHQRLAGAGYCFSASAPPYTSSASSAAIAIVTKEPQLVATLQKKAHKLRAGLKAIPGISFGKDDISPLVHIRLQPSLGSAEADTAAIKAIQQKLLNQYNIATYVPEFIPADKYKPVPSLRVCVMATHSDADIDALLKALKDTIPQSLKRN